MTDSEPTLSLAASQATLLFKLLAGSWISPASDHETNAKGASLEQPYFHSGRIVVAIPELGWTHKHKPIEKQKNMQTINHLRNELNI